MKWIICESGNRFARRPLKMHTNTFTNPNEDENEKSKKTRIRNNNTQPQRTIAKIFSRFFFFLFLINLLKTSRDRRRNKRGQKGIRRDTKILELRALCFYSTQPSFPSPLPHSPPSLPLPLPLTASSSFIKSSYLPGFALAKGLNCPLVRNYRFIACCCSFFCLIVVG